MCMHMESTAAATRRAEAGGRPPNRNGCRQPAPASCRGVQAALRGHAPASSTGTSLATSGLRMTEPTYGQRARVVKRAQEGRHRGCARTAARAHLVERGARRGGHLGVWVRQHQPQARHHHRQAGAQLLGRAVSHGAQQLDGALLGAPHLVLNARQQRGQHQLHALACRGDRGKREQPLRSCAGVCFRSAAWRSRGCVHG
jgi:hypothetical protein